MSMCSCVRVFVCSRDCAFAVLCLVVCFCDCRCCCALRVFGLRLFVNCVLCMCCVC